MRPSTDVGATVPLLTTRTLTAAVALASLQLALAGCGAAGPTAEADPSTAPAPSATTSSPSGSGATVSKVLVIVEENRSVSDVEAHMPFFVSQTRQYGTATDYHANQHPSLANYLVMTGGSIFGIADDKDPAAHPLTGPSVFTQMIQAGRTAKTYAEAMPDTCVLQNSGSYAVRHNPWTYYADPSERAACQDFDLPLGTTTAGELHDDVAAGQLPNLSFVIPDICNDGHDCPAGTADDWLRTWLPVVEQGRDFQSGELAVVVTWDEDDGTDGNRIPLAVLHRSLQGASVSAPLDHHALSASLSRLAGAPPLRDAKGAPDLLAAFQLRPAG
jgi:phospholipase C